MKSVTGMQNGVFQGDNFLPPPGYVKHTVFTRDVFIATHTRMHCFDSLCYSYRLIDYFSWNWKLIMNLANQLVMCHACHPLLTAIGRTVTCRWSGSVSMTDKVNSEHSTPYQEQFTLSKMCNTGSLCLNHFIW